MRTGFPKYSKEDCQIGNANAHESHLIQIRLKQHPLCDGDKLAGGDVGPHHHGQHSQQLLGQDFHSAFKASHPYLFGYAAITIKIIHGEGKLELFRS